MAIKHQESPAISFGPRVMKSPFFDATLRHGASAFTVYNHTYMPTCYSDPLSEYWSLVNDVTLWDVSCERQIEIRGPDAIPFMDRLTPRDLSNCPSRKCLYVLLTAADGGIVNDAVMMHLEDDIYWVSPGDGDVELWAQGVASQAGLDVRIRDANIGVLQLQGPKAPYVAHELFGRKALDLGYYHVTRVEHQGVPLWLSRTGWSGELGYEIYLGDHEHGDELWESIMAAGKPWNIAPAAPSTIRSIEGGILSYASDIRRADNPWTIGLGRLVNLDKPSDFIGRDALQRIHDAGTPRKLAGIEVSGEPIEGNQEMWPVEVGGMEVGHVSRCAWSPRLKRTIGFANLPVELAEPGMKLDVCTVSGLRGATVVRTPWFPAQKTLPDIGEGS